MFPLEWGCLAESFAHSSWFVSVVFGVRSAHGVGLRRVVRPDGDADAVVVRLVHLLVLVQVDVAAGLAVRLADVGGGLARHLVLGLLPFPLVGESSPGLPNPQLDRQSRLHGPSWWRRLEVGVKKGRDLLVGCWIRAEQLWRGELTGVDDIVVTGRRRVA